MTDNARTPHTDGPSFAGAACERSRLSPAVRLCVTFAVLLALKWMLPRLAAPAPAQVLVLLVVATWFVWRFWWNCSADRRGPSILIGSLWIAGVVKIIVQSRT